VVRVVPPAVWHLTLAWVDMPIDRLDAPLARAAAANDVLLRRRFTAKPPLVVIREAAETVHGVRLVVDSTAELDDLAEQAVGALRAGYGADAPIQANVSDPHIAIAYGRAHSDLLSPGPLPPVDPPVVTTGALWLVHLDTYAETGPEITPAWSHCSIGEGGLFHDQDGDPCLVRPLDPPPRYTPHNRTLLLPG
jgi:hypothetical protein